MPEAGVRTGSEVTRAGELSLPSQEQLQHVEEQAQHFTWVMLLVVVGRGVSEPALNLKVWERCPHYLTIMWWYGRVRDTPPYFLPLTICHR